MPIELKPTLIDMYRETFEGAVKPDCRTGTQNRRW
jgi:hypothetical protein